MRLEDQVCSLELAGKLKELGVKQDSYFGWFEDSEDDWYLHKSIELIHPNNISAFTVAELGEMLKTWGNMPYFLLGSNSWEYRYGDILINGKSEANTRAKMLIHHIKNKLIKVDDL